VSDSASATEATGRADSWRELDGAMYRLSESMGAFNESAARLDEAFTSLESSVDRLTDQQAATAATMREMAETVGIEAANCDDSTADSHSNERR
jgi:hypothetical protein